MPSVLIAGCGYLGAATADLFCEKEWEVEGWTASADSSTALSMKPYLISAVDIGSREAVTAAAKDFDTVIHCASSRGGDEQVYRQIYLRGAQNLALAFPQARLVFTSSTSVYPQTDGAWVTELSPAEASLPTSKVLRETEEFVLGHGGIVTRLAGIYGPGRSALLRKFLTGTATIDPGPEHFLNQIHRDDVASALFFLAQRALEKAGRTFDSRAIYNVSDNHPRTQRACYEWLASISHRPVPPVGAMPAPRRRGNSNKRVSSEKLKSLGWKCRYPTFEEAMRESILPDFERPGT